MLKIFAVVLIAGHVGGTVGPLDMTFEQCTEMAESANVQAQKQIATGMDINGFPLTRDAKTIKFTCVTSETRPEITYDENRANQLSL